MHVIKTFNSDRQTFDRKPCIFVFEIDITASDVDTLIETPPNTIVLQADLTLVTQGAGATTGDTSLRWNSDGEVITADPADWLQTGDGRITGPTSSSNNCCAERLVADAIEISSIVTGGPMATAAKVRAALCLMRSAY